MKKVFTLLLTLLTVSTALSLGNDETTSTTTSGTLQVRITDSETSSFGLTIEIVNVEVYNETTGWISLNNYQQTISSLSFTKGDESLLANANIPSGTYTKLRLTFGEGNSIYNVKTNEGTSSIIFDSNETRQVEVNISKVVAASDTSEIVINFDVSTSVIVDNNSYILNPVVEEMIDPALKTIDQPDFTSLSSRY